MGMVHEGNGCITLEAAKEFLNMNSETPLHLQALDLMSAECEKCKATILKAREETGIWTSGKSSKPLKPKEQVFVHKCPHCNEPLGASKMGFFQKIWRWLGIARA